MGSQERARLQEGLSNLMDHFIELSLFYVETAPEGSGAPEISSTATVLYGEGRRVARARQATARLRNLGDRLRVLQLVDDHEVVLAHLTDPFWDYNLLRDGSKRMRLLTGLLARPPILGLPRTAPDPTSSPGDHVGSLEQYICADKRALLERLLTGKPKEAQPRAWLSEMLDRLGRLVERDFRDKHAHLLGDVLILSDEERGSAPVSWEVVATGDGEQGGAERLRIHIKPSCVPADELYINARIFGTDSAPISDVLCTWKRGDPTQIDVPCNQPVGEAHLRAWAKGSLLWEQRYPLVLEVSFRMNLIGGTVHLKDKLSDLVDRAHQGGNAHAKTVDAATKIQQIHGERSTVSGEKRSPWRANELGAKHAIFDLVRPGGEEAYHYQRGGEGRAQAVLRLAGEIAKSSRAWLVDPFFDQEGASALLPRIGNQDVQLIIYTSLPNDKGSLSRLQQYLAQARAVLLPLQLTVYRLTKSDGGQPFHDRFLILERSGDRPIGYMLSNSLSGAAKDYPLVITELPPPAVGAVLDDMDDLASGAHTRNKQRVNVDRLWPLAQPAPQRLSAGATSWFPGWRFYLARCLPRRGRWQATWAQEAISAGVFRPDSDGDPRWHQPREKTFRLLEQLLPWPLRTSRLRRIRGSWARGSSSQLPGAWLRSSQRVAGVLAIGELAARGVEIEAEEVAERLYRIDTVSLGKYLRASLDLPKNLHTLSADVPRNVAAFRQLMASSRVDLDIIRAGLSMWSDTHSAMDMVHGGWGRRFSYEVLSYADASLAVEIGEKLRDPCFLTGILRPFARSDRRWPTTLSTALLRAKSAFLHALGAQSLAAPTEGHNFSARPIPPGDVAGVLVKLEAAGIPEREQVLYLVVWGTTRGHGSPAPLQDLAAAVVARAQSLSDEDLAGEVLLAILNGPDEFLRAVMDVSTADQRLSSARLLEAFINTFGRELKTTPDDTRDDLYFHEQFHYGRTRSIAAATFELARRRGEAPRAVVERASRRQDLLESILPLTPFRRRSGAGRARLALLWSILWELCAAAQAAGHPSRSSWASEVAELAVKHLADGDGPLAAELRTTLAREMIALLLAGVTEIAPQVVALTTMPDLHFLVRMVAAVASGQEPGAPSKAENEEDQHRLQLTEQLHHSLLELLVVALPSRSPLLAEVPQAYREAGRELEAMSLTSRVAALRAQGKDDEAQRAVEVAGNERGYLALLLGAVSPPPSSRT